jgi:hypothetical protein
LYVTFDIVEVSTWNVADKVRTKYGKFATIETVHIDGTVDIVYDDSRYGRDDNVKPELLKHPGKLVSYFLKLTFTAKRTVYYYIQVL